METKIIVQVYDPKCIKPPYKFIEVDKFVLSITRNCSNFIYELINKINERGYDFRFYSITNKSEIVAVVHNKNSPGSFDYEKDILKMKGKK